MWSAVAFGGGAGIAMNMVRQPFSVLRRDWRVLLIAFVLVVVSITTMRLFADRVSLVGYRVNSCFFTVSK